MTGEGGQDPGTFITVPSFPLKASMLLGVAAVIWIAVYFLIDPKYQAVTALVGAAAAGVGALLGAYYAGQMLRTQIRQHEVAIAQRNNDQSRERMQVALHYGERWSDPNIFHAKQVCLEIMKIARDDRGPEEVCKFLDSDETDNIGKILNTSQQKQVNMGQLLNFLEEFSIARDERRC